MQVTNVEITNTIVQLLNPNECALVNPVAYIISVRNWALQGQPLPVPMVQVHLPPLAWAVCEAKADIYARVVYLYARQGE